MKTFLNTKEGILKWLRKEKPNDWKKEACKNTGIGTFHPGLYKSVSPIPDRVTFLEKPHEPYLCKLHYFTYANALFYPHCRLVNCFFCQISSVINVAYLPVLSYRTNKKALMRVSLDLYEHLTDLYVKYEDDWSQRVFTVTKAKKGIVRFKNKNNSHLLYDPKLSIKTKTMRKWCRIQYNKQLNRYKETVDRRVIYEYGYAENNSWDSVFSA